MNCTDLNQFLNAIREGLEASVPGLISCETHRGQFDADELSKVCSRAPAFRVALWEIGSVTPTHSGEMDILARFSVAVLTTDKRGTPREVAANALVTALATLLPEQTWGVENALEVEASSIHARNLYSGRIAAGRTQLWEVTWSQALRLGEDAWQGEGVQLTHIYAGQSPDIGTPHEQDYVEYSEDTVNV